MAKLLPLAVAVNVQRAVKTWLAKEYPAITFENLPENDTGICYATIQSPAYAARYISGGYKAEYRFRIITRVLPSDDADMLNAVEALAAVGTWMESTTPPTLDTGCVNVRIERTSDVAILTAYEDGCNDYGIDYILSWEVI